MTSKAVASLTAASTLAGTEQFYADNGSDVSVTANLIKSFCNSGLTVSSLPEGWISVKDYGALGDDSNDDTSSIQDAIDAAFVVCVNNASAPPAGNKVLYFPPGIYRTTAPLELNGTFGAKMIGAGRFATQINNVTSGSTVIVTNGCQYTHFGDMLLQATGSGSVCFDLDWDGSGAALQSNTFQNMNFGSGDYGVRIAHSGFMGSENLFLNCFWINHAVAGLRTEAANALQQCVIGGNFQGCDLGIHVLLGGCEIIHGVGFQANTTWDIKISNAANDAYSISGCRTESDDFLLMVRGRATVSGCTQTSTTSGMFVQITGLSAMATILNCCSVNGQVDLQSIFYNNVIGCDFGRDDWYGTGANFNFENVLVGLTNEGSGNGTSNLGLSQGFVGYPGTAGTIYYTKTGKVWSGAGDPSAGIAVSALPPSTAAGEGFRMFVTDASTNTFGAAVVGGSTYAVPIYSDGSSVWKIG